MEKLIRFEPGIWGKSLNLKKSSLTCGLTWTFRPCQIYHDNYDLEIHLSFKRPKIQITLKKKFRRLPVYR